MKLIALLVVYSILMCLDARAVKQNSLAETAGCPDDPNEDPLHVCAYTAPLFRLVLQPSRTLRLIKEALVEVRSTFSLKEVLEGVLGALTVPLSAVIHSPEIFKKSIEEINGQIIPYLKKELKSIEESFRVLPLWQLKSFVVWGFMFPPHSVIQVVNGFVVALHQSGFSINTKFIMSVIRNAHEVIMKIIIGIWDFECTHILSQRSCDSIFHAYENIAVNPAFNFVNGVMALVEKVVEKIKHVVIPIVEKFTPLHLERYCKLVLSEENCAKIFLYVREMDKFGKEEMIKVDDLAHHVIHWIEKHIFNDNVLSELIKNF